jgi:hypothetical protein
MIAWTIYLTLAGALVALMSPGVMARWTALVTTAAAFVISLLALVNVGDPGVFQTITRREWVPLLGMQYHLAADGISLTLCLVTGLTAVCAVLFSWDVDHRPNEFFFWLLLVVAGSFGVFLSADLFLFFVFYEVVIVPKYFLIAIWGSTNKEYGAMKLTLYSFLGGALVMIGIIAIYVTAGKESVATSLSLHELARFPIATDVQAWVFPILVSRIRHPWRRLAIAHLGADRSRRRADRRLNAACRNRDEAGRLRRAADRDEPPAGRLPIMARLDCRRGCNRDHLRGSGRAAPARSEVRDRLLEREPHGFRAARARGGHRRWARAAPCCRCSRTAS